MAKFDMGSGIEEYRDKLSRLGVGAAGVCRYAVYPGAAIVIEAIKANTPVDSGDLRNSTVLTEFRDENGFIYTKVTYTGYDTKGTPNILKARALESGTSRMKKHPFIRQAVNRSRKAAEAAIAKAFNEKADEIMK